MTPISNEAAFTQVSSLRVPGKAATAAKDFEALLVGQMLQTIREQGSGWLGGGEDSASATAFGLGEQSLAAAIASSGGFGLGRIIQRSLEKADVATNGMASEIVTQHSTAVAPGQAPPSLASQR